MLTCTTVNRLRFASTLCPRWGGALVHGNTHAGGAHTHAFGFPIYRFGFTTVNSYIHQGELTD